jgi:simple sugar transport system permease protein
VLNLGIEGMMIMGAVTGFGVTLTTGNVWLGIAAAAMVGGVLSLIHAFLSITLRANQVVSGLALTMFGLGMSGLVGKMYIGKPLPFQLRSVPIPLLSELPFLGPILFQHDPLVYLSFFLAPFFWFFLFKTRVGISIRSVGESPATADALGVNVFLVRYLCVILGGILAGMGGAYLSVVYAPAWIEGMTAGAGWIVIALTIFSMWSPLRALLGAYLFGGVKVLQYRLQKYGISPNLLAMLPFIFTIIVLLAGTGEVIRKRIGAPSALGIPYAREEK